MFKLLVLSCLLVSCLADPLVVPSWLSEVARRLGQGCADRAEGWRACARLEDPFALAPHSRDCGAFFYCTGQGRPACRRCPAGLHFNPQLQVCDWPSNVDCISKPYPTTTEEDSSSTVTDSSTRPEEYFTTEPTSTTKPEEWPTSEAISTTALEESSTSEATSTTALEESSTSEATSTTALEESSTSEATSTTISAYYWG